MSEPRGGMKATREGDERDCGIVGASEPDAAAVAAVGSLADEGAVVESMTSIVPTADGRIGSLAAIVTNDGQARLPSHDPRPSSDEDPALALLRPLARRAIGMSGADVERLVREARGRARRAGRHLAWQDLEDLVSGGRADICDDLRWRLAIHECGHVLVHLALGRRGDVDIITIEDREGGFVRIDGQEEVLLSEHQAVESLAMLLAGRRAEILFFGHALSGAGGSPESDLGRATALAILMETSLGFGRRHPLVFRPIADPAAQLAYDSDLVERVEARLEEADAIATVIIEGHTATLTELAQQVARQRTLEGEALRQALGAMGRKLRGRRP